MNSSMPFIQPLIGGILIGLASWLLLASHGRVLGVSGIAASALDKQVENSWRWAFFLGLIATGTLMLLLFPHVNPHKMEKTIAHTIAHTPVQATEQSTTIVRLVFAGLLVGFGTVWGSGCTSGHGVCGLGRRSRRSLVAVLVFMSVAMVTVAFTR